jgi:hypothetical protein
MIGIIVFLQKVAIIKFVKLRSYMLLGYWECDWHQEYDMTAKLQLNDIS